MATSHPMLDAPALAAHNDRYLSLAKGKFNWQVTACLALLLAMVLAVVLAYQYGQRKEYAYVVEIDEVGVARDVSVIAPDGSGLRNLTAQSAVAGAALTPRWTADGAQILFSHRTSTGDGAIWIMNADGTEPIPLTNPSKSQIYPTLSPS